MGLLCVPDFKWGGTETMGMKKTWHGCEKQTTSITLEGTVSKMVHEEVDVHFREKYSPLMCLNDTTTIPAVKNVLQWQFRKELRFLLRSHQRFDSFVCLDLIELVRRVILVTYTNQSNQSMGVFEQAKGSSCESLMSNCSH